MSRTQIPAFKIGDVVCVTTLCKRLTTYGISQGMTFTLGPHHRDSRAAHYHFEDNADLPRRYDEHVFYSFIPPGVDRPINIPQDCLSSADPLVIIDLLPVGVST